jgi:hypothetical protein
MSSNLVCGVTTCMPMRSDARFKVTTRIQLTTFLFTAPLEVNWRNISHCAADVNIFMICWWATNQTQLLTLLKNGVRGRCSARWEGRKERKTWETTEMRRNHYVGTCVDFEELTIISSSCTAGLETGDEVRHSLEQVTTLARSSFLVPATVKLPTINSLETPLEIAPCYSFHRSVAWVKIGVKLTYWRPPWDFSYFFKPAWGSGYLFAPLEVLVTFSSPTEASVLQHA